MVDEAMKDSHDETKLRTEETNEFARHIGRMKRGQIFQGDMALVHLERHEFLTE